MGSVELQAYFKTDRQTNSIGLKQCLSWLRQVVLINMRCI